MSVLISGAGIGGLTTALMLHKRGIKCRLFERAPEVRELGVGINVLPSAIKELVELDLLDALDNVALRTREMLYLTKYGQQVWSELRGVYAGHDVPQFSIHRGNLQKVLYDAVVERLGPEAVVTGCETTSFIQDEGGVTVFFSNSLDGGSGTTVRGEILIGADGIHSATRKIFYPDEGRPSWQGVVMWRGAAMWPQWLDGQTMAIAGGLGGKLVLYPIAHPNADGLQLMNWVVGVRIKDGEVSPPPLDSWSRMVPLSTVLPYARRFEIDGFDVEGLIKASGSIFEYPMADRDPLPRWSHGRVTLLGDAAHPMYPVGSNGATQAILDARCLADELKLAEHPREALMTYEQERMPKTAEIVRLNRIGGPERVIDAVEKRNPGRFEDIENVMSYKERQEILESYAKMAGFSVKQTTGT